MSKMIFTLLTLASIVVSAVETKKTAEPEYFPNPLAVAEYISNYKTVGEYLNGMNEHGFISNYEKDQITQILNDKKIALTEEFILPKSEGKKLTWGKNSLSYEGKGSFQTQDGVYIRFNKNETADQIFLKTYNAMTNQKTSLLKSLLMNEAYAQDAKMVTRKALEAVGSGLYTTGYHALKSISTVLFTVFGVVTNVAGTALEQVTVPVADFLYRGSVACEYGSYRVKIGSQYVNWKAAYDEHVRLEKSYPLDAIYTEALNGFVGAGFETVINAFSPHSDKEYLRDEILSEVFPKEIPKCNEKNAEKVELYLKAKAKKIETKLKEARLKAKADGGKKAPAQKGQSRN